MPPTLFAEKPRKGWGTEVYTKSENALEAIAQGELHEAWGHGADGLAEVGAGNVALDRSSAKELGVVEDVEGFSAEFKGAVVFYEKAAGDGGIKILHAGAGEEAPPRVAHGAKLGQSELRRIEDRHPAAGVGVDGERVPRPVGRVDSVVVDAVGNGAEERSVVVVEQRDGQSGGEARDAGEGVGIARAHPVVKAWRADPDLSEGAS